MYSGEEAIYLDLIRERFCTVTCSIDSSVTFNLLAISQLESKNHGQWKPLVASQAIVWKIEKPAVSKQFTTVRIMPLTRNASDKRDGFRRYNRESNVSSAKPIRDGMFVTYEISMRNKYVREEIANCTKMAVLASRALTMRHGLKLECSVARYPEKS